MAAAGLETFVRQLRQVLGPLHGGGLTDAQLLERWLRRDEAAFEVLLWRHGPLVLGVCRRLLRRQADVEDAFQATFLTLVRRAGSVRTGDALAGWLYRVAYRVALRAREREARRREGGWDRSDFDPPARPTSPGPDGREVREILDEEVERLPELYRVPFILCYLAGKTNAEAAAELGCPLGTVLSRLHGARARLRARLTRRGLAPASAFPPGALASREAVPAPLIEATLRASGGAASAPVLALVKGVVRTMVWTRLKIVTALALTTVLAGGGTGWVFRTPVALPSARAAAPPVAPPEKPAQEPGLPPGWFGGSAKAEAYEVGLDRKVRHGGAASAYVRLKDAAEEDFGTLLQTFQAKNYRGKRVRLSGYVKTQDLAGWAGLWMRVDGEEATVAFDNMHKRPIKGSQDWKKYEIVLDIPDKGRVVTFGLLVAGSGTAWVDDFKVEVVGKDVQSTNLLEAETPIPKSDIDAPAEPKNLDFEEKSK